MKRERSPVSRETTVDLWNYLNAHWPAKFDCFDYMLKGSRMSALKLLNKGPWAITVGSKRRSLMRVRTDNHQLIVEPFGDKGWRLGIVRLMTTHGLRVSRRNSRNRWVDIADEGLFDEAVRLFVRRHEYGFGGGETQTLFFDDIRWNGDLTQIKYTVRHRAGKSLFKADSTTVQRWLIGQHGVEANTRYMDGLNNLVSRLCEDERPTASRVVMCEGKDITVAYAKEEAAHSCMTGRIHTDKVELYSLNPSCCKLALISENYGSSGLDKVIARCLIWVEEDKNKKGRQIWYVDRGYPPSGKTMNKIRTALNTHVELMSEDVEIRWFREESYIEQDDYYDDDHFGHDDCMCEDCRRERGVTITDTMSPVFRLNLPKSMIMPYMDTLTWAQVLSDGTALFGRSPDRLIPFSRNKEKLPRNHCPIKLEDGVYPLMEPDEQMDVDGGNWQPTWAVCIHCKTKINTHPIESFGGGNGWWSVHACKSCFKEKYVTVWHKMNGGYEHRLEVPVLETKAYWSKNLDAFVAPGGVNCRNFLVWDQDANEGKGDYFDKDDPVLKKKKGITDGKGTGIQSIHRSSIAGESLTSTWYDYQTQLAHTQTIVNAMRITEWATDNTNATNE